MNYTKIVAKLIKEFGVDATQIYKLASGFDFKVIIKRQGMDRIEAILSEKGWRFDVEFLHAHPYDNSDGMKKSYVFIKAIASDGMVRISTTAGANPDNCLFPNYLEVAEKRARHRAILRASRLSELSVFSEEESAMFHEPDLGKEITDHAIEHTYTGEENASFDPKKLDKEIARLDKRIKSVLNEQKKKKNAKRKDPEERDVHDSKVHIRKRKLSDKD